MLVKVQISRGNGSDRQSIRVDGIEMSIDSVYQRM